MNNPIFDTWWRAWFNGKNFNFPSSPDDTWNLEWDRSRREPGSFYQECISTAQLIADRSTEPIKVMFSGWKDSEIVAESFRIANIPFSCVIVRLENDLNIHDTSYAVIYCEQKNIPYEFLDINLTELYRDQDFLQKYEKYDRASSYSDWMYIFDQIPEGTLVAGNGILLEFWYKSNPDLKVLPKCCDGCDGVYGSYIFNTGLVDNNGVSYQKYDLSPSPWIFSFSEIDGDAWPNYMYHINRSSVTKFFSYTPEIALSTLKDPLVQKAINNEIPGLVRTADIKEEFYAQYFDFIKRPKFTGYEKFKKSDAYQNRCKYHRIDESKILQYHFWYQDLIGSLNPKK